MKNELLIFKMINQLKKDGINHIVEISTTNNCSNVIFTNTIGKEYIFSLSILERNSGCQAVYYIEEGEGKNKVMKIFELTDELYYDRMRNMIKYVLK